jgi:hypothetical protein
MEKGSHGYHDEIMVGFEKSKIFLWRVLWKKEKNCRVYMPLRLL